MGTYTSGQTFGTTSIKDELINATIQEWDFSADTWSFRLLTQDIGTTDNQGFEEATSVGFTYDQVNNKVEMTASQLSIAIPAGKEVYKVEVRFGTTIMWQDTKAPEIEFLYGGDYIITDFSITLTP